MLDDGRKVTVELFRTVMDEELASVATTSALAFDQGKFPLARQILRPGDHQPDPVEFLTLPAYELLPDHGRRDERRPEA